MIDFTEGTIRDVVRLRSIGVAVPRYCIEQQEAASLAATFQKPASAMQRANEAIYRRSMVQSRGSVLLESPPGSAVRQTFFSPWNESAERGPTTAERMARYAQEAPPLAVEAARNSLRQGNLAPREITHLVTVSCTGFSAPGVDVELIDQLGLSPNVERTHVGFMGCHGALNGLRVAKAFCEADPRARVLVCAVELCSLHFCYSADAEKLVSNAIFADGAAAAIVAADGARQASPWRLAATGGGLFPDCRDAMGWQVGNHGFEMSLAATVPDLIEKHLPCWLAGWLGRQGLNVSDVRSWAIHPGGIRIVRRVCEVLGVPCTDSLEFMQVYSQHGNMSSATILFVLQKLMQQNAPRPCVALGFGPGLAVEGLLLR